LEGLCVGRIMNFVPTLPAMRARSVSPGRRWPAAAGAVALLLAAGCDKLDPRPVDGSVPKSQVVAERNKIKQACGSGMTYQRLKELAFDEARRVRNAESENFERLAAATVIRMEEPVVKSRDEVLNVTVCTGQLILELPPGTAAAFAGERRLSANVEYAAQAAVDGSGLVYQMDGAEPIIYRLAAFDLRQGRRPRRRPPRPRWRSCARSPPARRRRPAAHSAAAVRRRVPSACPRRPPPPPRRPPPVRPARRCARPASSRSVPRVERPRRARAPSVARARARAPHRGRGARAARPRPPGPATTAATPARAWKR
jgi:hypothetical protein